ncbi:hypothetical protein ABIB29_000528 [Arthrobacter sp. UYEF36]
MLSKIRSGDVQVPSWLKVAGLALLGLVALGVAVYALVTV